MSSIPYDVAELMLNELGKIKSLVTAWGMVSRETAMALRKYPLGRFCVLIISLVLNYEFLPAMLRLSKAFTKAIIDNKNTMALVNRVIETGCSRKRTKRFVMMLQKYAGEGTLFISLYRMNLVGENMLQVLVLVNKCKYLQDLDLSQTGITCMGVKLLVRVFKKVPKLKILTLDDNRIKGRGLVTLAQASEVCDNIKKLELEGNPVFSEMEWLAEYDLSSIMFNVVKLDLARTGFTDKGMEVLFEQQKNAKEKKSVLLIELRVVENKLTKEGGRHAAELMMLGGLECLCIGENSIGSVGAVYIAMALETSKIKHLHMAKNGILHHGALALAYGLKASPTVFSVTLMNNELSKEGIEALMGVKKEHKTLRWFYI